MSMSRKGPTRRWPARRVVREGKQLLGLIVVAALLTVGAGVGMSYIAGFGSIWKALQSPSWPWLVAAAAGVGASFVGYYFGYRGIGQVEGGPDDLDARSRLAVVVAGFGGFLAHGGGALDEFVMRAAGASKREAKVRVTLLAGLEHGLLAVPCTVAAIVLIASGRHKPGFDFSIPWAVGPAVGFALAFWLAERYRERLRDATGWRGKLGVLYDAIHLVRTMMLAPRTCGRALFAMVVFWVSDMFALWAGMAAWGYRMNVASEVVAFGTAMIVTRRTGPLGGAGILMAALPPTLWQGGAPWTPAVLGTAVYRVLTLWLPMPASFFALPTLRALGESAGDTRTDEPALQH
jgi:uncharacterized membrane protein YbhN (UPF0104 family)